MCRLQSYTYMTTLLLFFVFSAAFPTLTLAAPLIQNVQGAVSDGNSITITGTNFGNNGPDIAIFDDFESGTVGNAINIGPGSATVGKWDNRGSSGTQVYSNDYTNSGSKSFRAITGTNYPSGYIYMRTGFPPTKEFYGSWYIYLPSEDPWPGAGSEGGQGGPNWKQVWMHSGYKGSACRDSDAVIPTNLGGGGAICGNCTGRYVRYGHNMNKGQWKRTMIYWKGSASGGGTVYSTYLIKNGINTVIYHANDNNITNMGSDSHNYTMVDVNGYCHVTVGGNSRMYIDDFYFATGANCRARVEIGDKSSYAQCTNLTVITPTAWQNNEIITTVRSGSFANCETVYLFVVDADGNVNTQGYPIRIVTGAGEPPCPPIGGRISK